MNKITDMGIVFAAVHGISTTTLRINFIFKDIIIKISIVVLVVQRLGSKVQGRSECIKRILILKY